VKLTYSTTCYHDRHDYCSRRSLTLTAKRAYERYATAWGEAALTT